MSKQEAMNLKQNALVKVASGRIYRICEVARAGDYGSFFIREDYIGMVQVRDGKDYGPYRTTKNFAGLTAI